ncbi:hypothetical protein OIU84_024158 [Salix udensis]|uniref:Uncharacterized protein n=1 Tax=Salix udensis TaxID=889485 RepID=A0AAD6KGP0_9ROSI|nr:hypothetical protein OIU84_024158 [Salix udensis]
MLEEIGEKSGSGGILGMPNGGGNGNGGNGSGRFINGGQFFISPQPILALILSTLVRLSFSSLSWRASICGARPVINRSNPNKNIGFKTTFEKSHRGESKGLQKLNAAERIGECQET